MNRSEMEYAASVHDAPLAPDPPHDPRLAALPASLDEGAARSLDDPHAADSPREPLHRILPRVEKLLREIRTSVEAQERDRRFANLSPFRWGAAVSQLIAAGFLAGALIDWLFQTPPAGLAGQLTKLGFAIFFQILTGCILLYARNQEE